MDMDAMIEGAASLRLASDRLVVRRVVEQDRETALAHEADERIMRHVRDVLPAAELPRKVDTLLGPWRGGDGEWLGLVVADRATDRMLGIVAFRVSREHETAEIGYRLHPDHHGRGLATEACRALLGWLFDVCGVRKVTALCVVENEASWRLMERLGMQREGQLREYSLLGGRWRDELVYGLLRREWTVASERADDEGHERGVGDG